jgi:hypothetical protein
MTMKTRFDVVHVNDFRQSNDSLWRTVNECLIEARHGLEIGLIHTPRAISQRVEIHPEIEALIATGLVLGIEAEDAVSAAMMTVHDHRMAGALWRTVHADRLVCVVDRAISRHQSTRLMRQLDRHADSVVVQGTDDLVHAHLRAQGLPTTETFRQRAVARRPLRQRHDQRHATAATLGGLAGYCRPSKTIQPWSDAETGDGRSKNAHDLCFHRYLTHIDELVAADDSYPALIARVHGVATRNSPRAEANTAFDIAREQHGPQHHEARLDQWLGITIEQSASRPRPQRVLMMSSNGVGLGHLTRLLAVARRLPADTDIHFLTMSHALPIVEQAGYSIDYLPFHVYAHCSEADWNDWLAQEVGDRIDLHGSDIVVYDGGQPYPGLIKALGQRPETRFVWLRRGMWQEQQNNAAIIDRQQFFDMIIEPADIAEAYDNGSTAYHRDLAVKVDPIRLLDAEELWSKSEACARLGLDPERPACLIQLGSGTNRDIVSMVDTILATLAKHPTIQPVIAEWLISSTALDLWPGVKRLRGFPLSRYFNAFDFSVSAAGYNSYNEIMSFALLTVFIANEHASMDDQAGRARFAQDQDAAFHLKENQSNAIAGLIEPLLDDTIRQLMKDNCRKLARENGAAQAAAAISRLWVSADGVPGR